MMHHRRYKNPTILKNDYVEKTRALLEEYQQVPVFLFSTFWDMKYDECIDFASLKYEGGLLGFLRDNHHLFELKRRKGIYCVSLLSRPTSRDSIDSNGRSEENISHVALTRAISKQRSFGRTVNRFYNKTNFLWADQPWINLLNKKDVVIARSAFETAMDVNHARTTAMITRIRNILAEFPLGLKITELYRHIPQHCTTKLLKVFSCSISIVSMVDELPEVFYRKRTQVPEKDYIFDAAIRTIPDLTGHDEKIFDELKPEAIVTRAINEGLYQKTLILIRETGVKGLKINVWMRSMLTNFYKKEEDLFERDVRGMNVLTFFLALARYDLVELESSESIKNDIRAFFPRKYLDFASLKLRLPNLINLDLNSEEPDSINEEPASSNEEPLIGGDRVTSNGQPPNKHVPGAGSILRARQNFLNIVSKNHHLET